VTRKYWYLVDVWRQRVDYPTLKVNVQRLALRWGARRVLVEDTGTGTSLVQELKGIVSGIIAVKPENDKVSRMAVASARFEAREIWFPDQAAWLPDLEAELFAFPGSRHDDQCDSISQALLDKNKSWAAIPPENWRRALALASIPDRRLF
jgi:predicted phage terminase large subunit-like protein